MQTPICEVCLKSDVLCSSCQDKLERKTISEFEINVLRFLYKMSEKIKILREVNIVRVIDSGVILIVSARGDAAKLVGKEGYVVKALAKNFKRSIRVLEEAPDFKKFVQDLISPSTIQGINTLYTQEGTVYKIRIPVSQRSRMIIAPDSFTQIIENVYNKKVELVFD